MVPSRRPSNSPRRSGGGREAASGRSVRSVAIHREGPQRPQCSPHCCILGSWVGSAYMGGQSQRWRPGAVRSAMARCRRPGRARTRRRVRTATPRLRRARCRPRLPTREQTCRGWPPIGRLPLLSRTSRPPHGGVAPGTPGNASRCRRGTRPRRLRHQLRPGAGRRADRSRAWRHPGSRRRRPSCRRGRHRRPRQADHGAPATGDGERRALRRPRGEDGRRGGGRRQLVAEGCGDRPENDEQDGDRFQRIRSGGALFVLVGRRSCRHSRQRGVASTYAVFDTPTICAGS